MTWNERKTKNKTKKCVEKKTPLFYKLVLYVGKR